MLQNVRIFYFIFSTLTLIGGVIGYLKAKSVASVVAGTISAAFLDTAALLLIFLPAQPTIGLSLGLLVSLALLGKFAPGYFATQKMMPAGMMTILGAISVVLTILAFLK